jgi:hypothetical protein
MLDPARYGKKLNIVVPYRDRAEHLRQFVPHMLTYFARDKLDRAIDVTINIVEQVSPAPFNRGKLKNAGFDLTRGNGDYVCFHDVDYLPIWADYGWSPNPARLIWHGLAVQEDHEKFFGGVVLFDNTAFETANGYPNCYWGWGPEDLELGYRCRLAGFDIEKRDGTYTALPHKHEGFERPGVHTVEARRMAELFRERRKDFERFAREDGLGSLTYTLADRQNVNVGGKPAANVVHYRVRIDD